MQQPLSNKQFFKLDGWSLTVLMLSVLIFSGYTLRGFFPFNFEMIFILILVALTSLIWTKKELKFSSQLITFSLLILSYFVYAVFNSLVLHEYGNVAEHKVLIISLFPAFLLFLWLIVQVKPSIDYFWYFLILASLVMLSWGLVEFLQVGYQEIINGFRLGDYYSNPIKFGVYANALFILMLGGIVWAYKKSPLLSLIWIVLLVINLVMVILSQTRTAWIGWPEALIGWGAYYLFLILRSSFSKPLKVLIIVAPITVGLLIIQSPLFNTLGDRVNLVIENVNVYLDGSDYDTSIGKRFVMYETAVNMIKEKPLVGHGADGFQKVFREESISVLSERFGIKFSGFEFSHVHNQFLMSAVQYGVVASFILLIIFVYLFIFFAKGIKQARVSDKPIFIAGLVFTVATFLAFMPESPLEFSGYSAHFLLFFCLLFGFSLSVLNESEN